VAGFYHTQVPNLAIDFVVPFLSGAETKCYLYVIRRTVGFVVAKDSKARKSRDRIALSQFETGMQSGNWVFNAGTRLTLNSIRKAIQSLQEKGLVISWHVCDVCSHEQPAEAALGGRQVKCQRCTSPCHRELGMVQLTARVIVDFLNANDPDRRWTYDKEATRFVARTIAEQAEQESIEQSLATYRSHMRYLELVDEAIAQLEKSLGRPLSVRQQIEGFYKPLMGMQEQAADHPQIIAKALTVSIKRGAFMGKEHRNAKGQVTMRSRRDPMAYARGVLQGELGRVNNTTHQQARKAGFDPAIEQTLNEKLRLAKQLNRKASRGDDEARDESRKLLSEMLGKRRDLARLLHARGVEKSDAVPRARALISWAYKIGETDVVEARQNRAPVHDHYPEWDWPEDLPNRPRVRRAPTEE
jgi:hypothetical protein